MDLVDMEEMIAHMADEKLSNQTLVWINPF